VPQLGPIFQACSHPWLTPMVTATLTILPVLYAFLMIPLLDYVLGEEEESALHPKPGAWHKLLYQLICHVYVGLHCAVLVTAAHVVTSPTISLPMILVTCLNVSIVGGFSFCVAHELVHSTHKFDRFMAELLLTALCYKQWGVSHMAHHVHVATHGDPATARYQEAVCPLLCSLLQIPQRPSNTDAIDV
jgi:alkane 1-monooxygenase